MTTAVQREAPTQERTAGGAGGRGGGLLTVIRAVLVLGGVGLGDGLQPPVHPQEAVHQAIRHRLRLTAPPEDGQGGADQLPADPGEGGRRGAAQGAGLLPRACADGRQPSAWPRHHRSTAARPSAPLTPAPGHTGRRLTTHLRSGRRADPEPRGPGCRASSRRPCGSSPNSCSCGRTGERRSVTRPRAASFTQVPSGPSPGLRVRVPRPRRVRAQGHGVTRTSPRVQRSTRARALGSATGCGQGERDGASDDSRECLGAQICGSSGAGGHGGGGPGPKVERAGRWLHRGRRGGWGGKLCRCGDTLWVGTTRGQRGRGRDGWPPSLNGGGL